MSIRKQFVTLFSPFLVIGLCTLLTSCKSPTVSSPAEYSGPAEAKSDAEEKKAPETPADGPLKITIEEAVLQTLENNRALKVERLTPAIRRTQEEQAKALFDPVITAGVSQSHQKTENGLSETKTSSTGTEAGISKFFPTGTTTGIDLATDRTGKEYSARAGLSVTQALLKGFGVDVNLATLRQAELDTLSSKYELRGFAESLVAQLESAYWDYALSERRLKIFTDSLKLAEQQLSETNERVKIGKLAETELAAAQAEVALRRQDLIDARSALAKAQLLLLRLLSPPGKDPWNREVLLQTEPAIPDIVLDDVESHSKVALLMRPDLNQAKLDFRRGELEIVKTKNGLLPKLDLFINLGKTGYAESFNSSVSNVSSGGSYDFSAGLSFEFPPHNRSASASHRRAVLSNKQAQEAIENLMQTVQVDVRGAYIEVLRAKEQVSATAATRGLQEEKLRAETEKFRVGKSTAFLVAQAQRDLVASQVSEIQAVVNYLKSLVELYRFDGTLLERRGISAPGREPVPEP